MLRLCTGVTAMVTTVRLFSTMNEHVALQVIGLNTFVVALRAAVLFLSSVGLDVRL